MDNVPASRHQLREFARFIRDNTDTFDPIINNPLTKPDDDMIESWIEAFYEDHEQEDLTDPHMAENLSPGEALGFDRPLR